MVASKMEQVQEELTALKAKRTELEQEIKELLQKDKRGRLTENEQTNFNLDCRRLENIEAQITQQTTILAEEKKQQTYLMTSGPIGLTNTGGYKQGIFYRAKVSLLGSKLIKGARAQVYQVASKCGAFYNESKEKSIYYAGNDLMVRVLFGSKKDCAEFINELSSRLRHFQLIQSIEFERKPEQVVIGNDPESIYEEDYVSNESDSQAYSVAMTRITHVTNFSVIDFEKELLMIEDPNHEDFVGLGCYRCHLMSQAGFPEEKDNPNNWLPMSWPLHQRFDGLNTSNNHQIPQIAIRLESRSGVMQVFEGGWEREKVEIAIECPDHAIFAVMRNRVKEGMKVDEQTKTIITSVFVEDAEDFERCLTFKYNETKFLWTSRVYGEHVTEEEAHTLRRSARLQAEAQNVENGLVKKKK